MYENIIKGARSKSGIPRHGTILCYLVLFNPLQCEQSRASVQISSIKLSVPVNFGTPALLHRLLRPKTGGAVRAGIFGLQNLQRFSGGRRFCRIFNQQLHSLHVGRILGLQELITLFYALPGESPNIFCLDFRQETPLRKHSPKQNHNHINPYLKGEV